ncbi:tyrosine-type recombinase/integrase [Pseudogemmobacter humi]|uniref:Tyrosine recombinase n=1 Tax=Pseudogemmobacter humi TaxID=2483812 RepID=A0A3P5X852_9RHOB|nr:tyrosine-type recombinase/integrase [Pseudogemmobacter humi]VDC30772.1 tyrosine recombinase [Pseudogemmobacter humi]
MISTKKSQELVDLNIPIQSDFRAVLEGIKHNHESLIITQLGEARSEKSFTNGIIEAAKEAALSPHRSPHGLRKAACRRLAEAGCTALEIMSITGHSNIKEIETYCAAVNEKRLA